MTSYRCVLVALVLVAAPLAGCVGSDGGSAGPASSDGAGSDPASENDTTGSGDMSGDDGAGDGNGSATNETGPEPITRSWTDDAIVGIPLAGDNKDEAVRRSYANRDTVNGTFVLFYDVEVPEGYAKLEGNLSAPQTDPVGIWPDYDLYLLDSNGTIVAKNTDVGTREEVSVDDPASGTWTFAAWYAIGETVEGAMTAAFTLEVKAVPDGAASGSGGGY